MTTATQVLVTKSVATPIEFQMGDFSLSVIKEGDALLFVAADACRSLGFKNQHTAVERHVEGADILKRKVSSGGQIREINVLTEAGLYSLIFGSKLKEAVRFRRWVLSDVIPSIRRTGGYPAPEISAPAHTDVVHPVNKRLALLGQVMREAGTVPSDLRDRFLALAEAEFGFSLTAAPPAVPVTRARPKKYDCNPTALGAACVPPRKPNEINLLLAEAGLQYKVGSTWRLTKKGEEYAEMAEIESEYSSWTGEKPLWSLDVLNVIGGVL